MSRHRPSIGYSFHIHKLDQGAYRISWAYDRYYAGSRLRFPQHRSRDTDEAGARRFAKKHGLAMPE